MATVINPTHSAIIELINDAKMNELEANRILVNSAKILQPNVGNANFFGASTVGGGAPQPPPSTSTGSGQIFPTGRQ